MTARPVLLIVSVLAMSAGPAFAQTLLEFSPSAGSVDCGETLFVDVTVDASVSDLRGFSLEFGFDPNFVTPVSVEAGGLLTGAACGPFFRWLNEASFTNTIQVDGSLLGCSTAGPGAIVRIGFAPGPLRGQSALTVVGGDIRDSSNEDIAYNPVAGTVDNVCNTAPDAVDDAYSVAEGGTLTAVALGVPAGVLDNDSDPDGDALTATLVTGPINAASFNLAADGSFTYVHDGSETIADQFVYEADDGLGGTTQATAAITVTPVNDAPEVINPGPQSSAENESVSLQIDANDDEQVTLAYTAAGLPPGLSIDPGSGLISGAVACGAIGGSPYAVTVDVDDLAGGITQVSFAWTITGQVAPAAIADLAAVQVKTGNDTDGTTAITLTWSGVAPGHTVAVFRKGFGDYPEYDDGTGTAPASPADPDQALLDNWTAVPAVVASDDTDEPATRDYYSYVAFVLSECGTVSAVSNLAGGVLNYHLGDVSDGVTPGVGDNTVGSADVSLLGFRYGTDDLDPQYLADLDIGPTADFSVDGRPLTDNRIEFEDLMMFSLNYGAVSKVEPLQGPAAGNVLVMIPPAFTTAGTPVEVQLWLEGDGQIHGLSVGLEWDSAVLSLTSVTAGPLLDAQAGPTACLFASPGNVDASVFTADGPGLTGTGLMATVTFDVLAEGDPALGFGAARVRGLQNQTVDLTLQVDTTTPVPDAAPAVSGLYPNYPNPFNPSTTLSFGVGLAGQVDLRIYGLNGRLVRTVHSGMLPPGNYRETWDGRDDGGQQVASGIYFVRLRAPDVTESRRITLVK